MDIKKDESTAHTAWRKWLSYSKSEDSFLGEDRFAMIVCIREVSGYAVWYRRYLEDAAAERDGSYLLKFFSHAAKHDAIEFAVQVAGPGEDAPIAIARLDRLAESALRMSHRQNVGDPFERIT